MSNKALFQADMQGFTGGAFAKIQGGTYGSGFLSGSVSSGFSSIGEALKLGTVPMIALGGVSGGAGSVIGGGNFLDGFKQGLITSGLNHAAHAVIDALSQVENTVAGIYGAGGPDVSGNPALKEMVEGQGGKMFASSWGTNDGEIIDYLKTGYDIGNKLKIYGHSRGATAVVRIANKLGEMGISIAEIHLYDPVVLYGGGGLKYNYNLVGKFNNYYQRNPIDGFLMWANNPFQGSPVLAPSPYMKINNVNLTGKYYNGELINHINITRYAIKNP